LLIAGTLVMAGPITPPSGPVGPTAKPLGDIEPRIAINDTNTPGNATAVYRITQLGSYYLTGNLTGASGKSGIEILSANVTVDLSGFTVQGVAGSTYGVHLNSSLDNITLRNGIVRGNASGGAYLYSSTGMGTLVSDVHASDNGGIGIAAGNHSIVRNCTSHRNQTGIIVSSASRVEGCIAEGNTGGDGIGTGYASTVVGCSSRNNSSYGVYVAQGSAVTDCCAFQNDDDGFHDGGTGCVFTRCTAEFNAEAGINALNGAVIRECVALNNSTHGVLAGPGSEISNCSATSNTLDGIRASTGSTIRDNVCKGNGAGAGDGAGITTLGSNVRIEGNNCSSNDRGIDVRAAGNIILRNTCSLNTTNWSIVANNVYAQIVDKTAPASAPVSGNAAASTSGSIDGNANFSY
jgi:parallel beta-helix repeat protein